MATYNKNKKKRLLLFFLVFIFFCGLSLNCAHTRSDLVKRDNETLEELWQKTNSISLRRSIVQELENRKAIDSLISCLNYITTFPTMSRKWPKSGLEDSLMVIKSLERLRASAAIPALQYASRSRMTNKELKLAILFAYKEINAKEAALPATDFLNDPDDEIRWQALNVLGHLKNEESTEAIFPMLSDKNPNIRMCALYALGEIGDNKAVERISLLLADEQESVRDAAESSLKKLDVPEKRIVDWKNKSDQLSKKFSIEDLYRSKIGYEKIVKEKQELEQKLENEADLKRQFEKSLEERELALKKNEELVESLYEKERQLKSKLFQLEITKNQSEEYKKELEALSNRADEMNKKLKLAESEVSSASVKKELDEILKEKSKLEEEANILKQREVRLRNEVSSLNAVAKKTRIEADKAKKEISLMRMREAQLARQVDELKKRLNRGMAPVLVVSKPKNGLKIDSLYVMLHLIAVDDKGISKADVILNNVPISLDSDRGIKVTAADKGELPKKIDITKRLQLQNGQNTIKVAVVDTDGITTEEVITIVREKERGDIWAIVIGINQYQNTRNLKYAVNDATAFNNYLNEYIGIPDEKIYFLTDQNATKNNIERILGTQIKRKAAKDDTVIIFYAGHGAVETDPSNPDGDGFEKYLLPYDADLDDLYTTSISMDDIKKIFQRIRAERLIFIADTCYSGASGGRTMLASKTRASLSDKFLERISKSKGRVIISSSSANEVSKEDDNLKHGIFSYYLLEGLKGKADQDTDGIITVSELFSFLSREVPNATGQDQHPVRKGETEGELLIGRVK